MLAPVPRVPRFAGLIKQLIVSTVVHAAVVHTSKPVAEKPPWAKTSARKTTSASALSSMALARRPSAALGAISSQLKSATVGDEDNNNGGILAPARTIIVLPRAFGGAGSTTGRALTKKIIPTVFEAPPAPRVGGKNRSADPLAQTSSLPC